MTRGAAIRRDWMAAGIGLIAVFALFVLPPIVSGAAGTSEAKDERRFHLPVVESFAAQWPRPDLSDYASATGPGVHLVLAAARRAGIEDARGLRAVNSAWGLALVLVVWSTAGRRAGPWTALLLVAPLLLSSYVLGGSIWITTDNAGLALAAAAVAAVLVPRPRRLAGAGLLGAAAVFVRQLHLWTAGLVAAGALMTWGPVRRWVEGDDAPALAEWTPGRRVAVAAAALLPFATLGILAMLWGGLLPPSLAGYHERGLRPATFVLVLALCGGFGACLGPLFVGRGALAARGPLVAAAVVALLAMIPATGHDRSMGRWGGAIWELVRRTPAPGDRSLVLIAAAATGAWLLAHAWRQIRAGGRGREGLLLMVAGLGWTAAHTANSQTWQRYAEPPVLIGLAWTAALVLAVTAPEDRRRAWWAGPGLLAAAQGGLLVITLVRPILAGG